MKSVIINIIQSRSGSAFHPSNGKGKTKPFPLMVDIKGCTQVPCDVYKGLTIVVQVHFVSSKANIHTLTAKCYATALGITVPYELPDDVADVVYDFQFNVDHYYPEIPATMQLNLVDKDNEVITCFSASIRVRKRTAANSVNGLKATELLLF